MVIVNCTSFPIVFVPADKDGSSPQSIDRREEKKTCKRGEMQGKRFPPTSFNRMGTELIRPVTYSGRWIRASHGRRKEISEPKNHFDTNKEEEMRISYSISSSLLVSIHREGIIPLGKEIASH